jgi:membrane fusion protein, multidrug efflux system
MNVRVLCVVAALAACGRASPGGPSMKHVARAYRVTAVTLASGPLVYSVDAVGALEAHQVVTVPARVEGALDRLDFDEGAAVTPQTVLAVIDERRYSLLVAQAQAAVTQAEAEAKQSEASAASAAARTARVQAELDEAESNLARWKGLRAKDPGFVAEEKIAGLEAAAKSARASRDEAAAGESEVAARRRAADSAIEARRAAVAIAQKNVEDASVRSPLAGVVQRRHVAVGQYVKAGDPIATLVDASRLRLRFSVSDQESVHLKLGQKVTFRVKAFGARGFEAALFHVDAAADATTRMVDCLATVADPDPALKPGFFAQVAVEVARAGASIVVPEGALLPTEKGFVAFVEKDGKASRRLVQLGLHTKAGQVEILDGLAAGERLLVHGAQSLDDGVPVEIVDER